MNYTKEYIKNLMRILILNKLLVILALSFVSFVYQSNVYAKDKSFLNAFFPKNRVKISDELILSLGDPFNKPFSYAPTKAEKKKVEPEPEYKVMNERIKIIHALRNFIYQGKSTGKNSMVLLSEAVCEVGKTLEDVIPNQTQSVYVDHIDFKNKVIFFKFVRVPEIVLPSIHQKGYFKVPYNEPEFAVRVKKLKPTSSSLLEVGTYQETRSLRTSVKLGSIDNRGLKNILNKRTIKESQNIYNKLQLKEL